MTALLSDPQAWLAFATLAVLEIVLGVDNIIFLTILVSKLPHAQQRSARISGLALAMCTRIGLLYSIVWLTRLTQPLIDVGSWQLSGRALQGVMDFNDSLGEQEQAAAQQDQVAAGQLP